MATTSYIYKLATSPQDYDAYFQLKQSLAMEEPELFSLHNSANDAIAYPILAIAQSHGTATLAHNTVVGIMQIYEPESGIWYGSQLGIHHHFRRVRQISRGLLYKAVTTANAWECQRFLATVEPNYVPLFQRYHWHSLQELMVGDRMHHLMEANLFYYPPNNEPRPRFRSWQLKTQSWVAS